MATSRSSTYGRQVSAATAKNQFGRVLDSAIAGERVAITKYGEVKAVLLSVEEYDSLIQSPARKLNLLTEHFDEMLARMQTDEAKRGTELGFNASPREMGEAAVRLAREKRASRALD